MKIRILKTCYATINNYQLKKFFRGKKYKVRETVGCRLIQRGEAVFAENNHQTKEQKMNSQIPYIDIATPPLTEPLTLAEVKLALRVDGSEDDSMIISFIKAARIMAEEYLRRSLITQTWKMQFDNFAPSVVNLPRGPLQSISEVRLIQHDWSEQVLSSSTYYLSANKEQLIFDAAPMAMIVQIKYIVGYGDSTDIPHGIKQGMLSHIVAMYENRGGARSLPEGAVSFYNQYRVIRL